MRTNEREEIEVVAVLPTDSANVSLSLDQDPSTLLSDDLKEAQKTEVETESQSNADDRSVGQQLQTEVPMNQTPEEERTVLDVDIKGKDSSKKDKQGSFQLFI